MEMINIYQIEKDYASAIDYVYPKAGGLVYKISPVWELDKECKDINIMVGADKVRYNDIKSLFEVDFKVAIIISKDKDYSNGFMLSEVDKLIDVLENVEIDCYGYNIDAIWFEGMQKGYIADYKMIELSYTLKMQSVVEDSSSDSSDSSDSSNNYSGD